MNKQAVRRKVRKRKSSVQNSRMKFGGFLGIMLLAVFLGYLTAIFVVGPIIGYDASESPAKAAEESQDGGEESGSGDDAGADSDEDAGDGSGEASGSGEAETDGDGKEAETSSGNLPTEGYALQFGAFSSREAAEELAETLESQGIRTDIVKMDDVYKVISPVVDTKEKALNELTNLPDTAVSDVFVASFQ